jgi:hypothetical protein
VDRRDTHRLIPARYVDEPTVLERIAADDAHLDALFDLDNATNDRLLAQEDRQSGIGRDELVFHVPNHTVVNAAFTHPNPEGSRFSGPERGAWYAGFELETAQAEVAWHRVRHYREIAWDRPEDTRYQVMLADFAGEFHDCRGPGFEDILDPDSYAASRRLAGSLLAAGSAGVVYPSVRRPAGTCLACFRPALVHTPRRGPVHVFRWRGLDVESAWK